MSEIVLPALRSDDSLGFLAALGTLELLHTVEGLEVALGWDGLGGEALLVVDLPDAAAVAERLRSVALRLDAEGRLTPADASLTLARYSRDERQALRIQGVDARNDPMRATPSVARDRLLGVADRERDGDWLTARWAAGLITMLGVDRTGTCLLTPLYAPAGQQVLAQLLGKYRQQACEPGMLHEALTSWRRRPDSGANLDHRDLRDGAWSARGAPENVAVAGATWLALMAAPLFRQMGDGRRGEATGWNRDRRSVRPRSLIWPVWSEPRSLEAVEALLSHPVVRAAGDLHSTSSSRRRRDDVSKLVPKLKGLGVSAVCSASRAPLGNADGPLRATVVRWP